MNYVFVKIRETAISLHELNYNMRYIRLAATIFTVASIYSCKTTPPVQNIVEVKKPFIEIGTKEFTPEDFQKAYQDKKFITNTNNEDLSIEAYLPIYTDARLKILEAQREGRDTTKNFLNEIASFKEVLSKNYFVDEKLVERYALEAYERMKTEVRASHILIPVSEYAAPEDTLQAYRAVLALRGRILEGEDFGNMAVKFSKDPTVKTNQGDLGYMTVFQTIYTLENAIYNLPTGSISMPIRTKSGYHILKVTDKRPNRGNVVIAHIMVKVTPEAKELQKQTAKSKIDEAYQKLKDGEKWDQVVAAYSDDQESARNGGKLPMFGVGKMVSEIEETAFALQTPYSYSTPVLSPYGWHIIQLIEKSNIGLYETVAPSIRQKVVTDSRGKILEEHLIQDLKKTYPIEDNMQEWNQVALLADSALLTGTWDYTLSPVSTNWEDRTLFKIEQQATNSLSFLQYVKKRQQRRPKDTSPKTLFRALYSDYQNEVLLQYGKDHLEERSPEFKDRMNELREGVLLSQLMESKVWQKSLTDSLGQLALYNQNILQYKLPERALTTVIKSKNQSSIDELNKMFANYPYLLERKANDLLFEVGEDQVTEAQLVNLNNVYVILEKNPDYVVEVAGYRVASESGQLSANRVKKAVQYLTSKNIPILRIIEKDYGSFRLSDQEALNHRVSFRFFSTSKKDVEKIYNEDGKNSVVIEEGYFYKENELFKTAAWKVGPQLIKQENEIISVHIQKIEPERTKTFAEAKGSVINDYQKVLEKELKAKLQEQFPVKVNEQELDKIVR